MPDHRMNSFYYRAVKKYNEYVSSDHAWFPFCRYTMRWLFGKAKRKLQTAEVILRKKEIVDNPDAVMMAVRVTGGLGDCVVLARVLRDLSAVCDNVLDFYLFLPSVDYAKWAFADVPNIKGVFPDVFMERCKLDCDCGLYLNSFAFFDEEHFQMDKIRRIAPKLFEVIATTIRNRKQWNVFIDNHPVLDGAFARQLTAQGKNRYNFIHSLMGLPLSSVRQKLPAKRNRAAEVKKKFPLYVTVNTGFDSMFVIGTNTATKCWPREHWARLVEILKKEHPELGVVQVGGKNSVIIPGCDFNFAAKTSLDEVAGVLQGSRLHIDIEGGLVHAASAIGTKSLVLFGPTSMKYFAYAENINLKDDFCNDCWWATERWMESCPAHHEVPCMRRLDPERVAIAVFDEISFRKSTGKKS